MSCSLAPCSIVLSLRRSAEDIATLDVVALLRSLGWRVLARERGRHCLNYRAAPAQSKERVRSDRVRVRPTHIARRILPAVDGDAIDAKPFGELILGVANNLAQVANFEWRKRWPLQDLHGEQHCNRLDHLTLQTYGTAVRTDECGQSLDAHSLHVDKVSDVVVDRLVTKLALAALRAADLRWYRFASHRFTHP